MGQGFSFTARSVLGDLPRVDSLRVEAVRSWDGRVTLRGSRVVKAPVPAGIPVLFVPARCRISSLLQVGSHEPCLEALLGMCRVAEPHAGSAQALPVAWLHFPAKSTHPGPPLLPFPLYLLASTVFPEPSFHAQNQFGLMRTVAANKQMDGGS